MIDFATKMLAQLEEEARISDKSNSSMVQRLSTVLNSARAALAELKTRIIGYEFPSPLEEIHFFKHVKPRFTAVQLFAQELFTIEKNKPLADTDQVKDYYNDQLRFFRQFITRHGFLYQYFLLGLKDLDHAFFLRNSTPTDVFIPEAQEVDSAFSSPADYLFARFIAYEQISTFLAEQLTATPLNSCHTASPIERSALRWTGKKANLIEMAYGIYTTMQLNDGKATLSEIIEWLQDSFNVNLDRYYRRFAEIKMRKSLSKTQFLEEMASALNEYILKDDALHAKTV